MITARGICTVVAATVFASIAQPGFAGSEAAPPGRSASDTDRGTERTSILRSSDSTTTAGERDSYRFTSTASEGTGATQTNPQLQTYVPRVNRLKPVRDSRERFPQPESPHDRPIVWLDKSEDTSTALDTDNPRKSGELESLLERDEKLVDEPGPAKVDDGNRIVFCNRTLLEMHLKRDCEMLGDVTPTPVPLRSAREARYAPCTVCYTPR